uniref:Uncharacterized protein n=1 Tax=Helianthus annuus TaxID=4232 RepID=A0A1Y3BX38_HELAN
MTCHRSHPLNLNMMVFEDLESHLPNGLLWLEKYHPIQGGANENDETTSLCFQLELSDKKCKFLRPSSGGMDPEKELYERSRYLNRVMEPMNTGMDPLKKFVDRSRYFNQVMEPMNMGMTPLKEFLERSRYLNLVIEPFNIEMVPLNEFP